MPQYKLTTQKVLDIEDDLTFVISSDNDIWMDQKTIAVLLGTTRRNITKHLNNKLLIDLNQTQLDNFKEDQ